MAKRAAILKKSVPLSLYILLFLSISISIALGVLEWKRNIVTHVVDGDTLVLQDGRYVRLLGVDAPKHGRCMADRAKARLESLTVGRHVRLKDVQQDEYGRSLANVIVNEPFGMWMTYLYHRFIQRDGYKGFAMINRVMVSEGMGKYRMFSNQYTRVLTAADEVARTGNLGIYSPVCRQLLTGGIFIP